MSDLKKFNDCVLQTNKFWGMKGQNIVNQPFGASKTWLHLFSKIVKIIRKDPKPEPVNLKVNKEIEICRLELSLDDYHIFVEIIAHG